MLIFFDTEKTFKSVNDAMKFDDNKACLSFLIQKKHSRVRMLDSDEEEEPEETRDRKEIEHELFEGDDLALVGCFLH